MKRITKSKFLKDALKHGSPAFWKGLGGTIGVGMGDQLLRKLPRLFEPAATFKKTEEQTQIFTPTMGARE